MVVVFHVGLSTLPGTGLWPVVSTAFNGNAAVELFFVLSGFVMGIGLDRITPTIYARFLARRAIRLIPPIIAAGVVLWLLRNPISREQAIGHMLLTDISFNGALWSIRVELLACLFYPALLVLSRMIPMTAQIAFAALLTYAQLRAPIFTVDFGWGQFNTLPHLFFIGTLVPTVGKKAVSLFGRPGLVLSALIWFIPWRDQTLWVTCAVPVAAGYVVAWVAYREPALLRHTVCRHLGRISYSLYVLHIPVISWWMNTYLPGNSPHDKFAVLLGEVIPTSIIAATLFYYAVERPSIRLARTVFQPTADSRTMRRDSLGVPSVAERPTQSV